jgi:HK97 family phage major capsid protein
MLAPARIKERATEYFSGERIKALGNGKIGGYGIVFNGPKDAQGEFFYPHVELHLDWFGGTRRPVLYHHGLRDEDLIEEIGYVTKITKDGHGWWIEAQLDMGNPIAQQVYGDVRKGKIGWSSGSAPHLSKVDASGGISEWTFIEASLTPTPAAGKRTTVQALKFDFTSTPKSNTDAAIEPGTVKEPSAKTNKGERKLSGHSIGKLTMNVTKSAGLIGAMQEAGIDSDSILKVLLSMEEGSTGGEMMTDDAAVADDAVDPATMSVDEETKDAGPVTTGDSGAEIRDTGSKPAMTPPAQTPPPVSGKTGGASAKTLATALQIAMATMKTAPATSKAGGYQGRNPARMGDEVANIKARYSDLDAADMALAHTLLTRRKGGGREAIRVRPEFFHVLAQKAMADNEGGKLRLHEGLYQRTAKLAIKDSWNNTLVADDGGDWVPDLWSSILWMRVRIDNNVAKNVEVFAMPSPTFEYPIEADDPVVYAVGQTDTDAEMTFGTNPFTRSRVLTDKIQFTAKKTGLQVPFSTEINEDSIIPFIPQLRAQAVRAFANSIDYNLLNSDSATGTGNINYKGANTSAAPTSNFLFGGGNGMRYNGLVTNPTGAQYNFLGGIPTLSGIRTARFKMISSLNAYGINPADLVIITDPFTYGKFLSIDEINTFMNNGRNATVNTGLAPDIDGTPVHASWELKLSDSTGYVTATNTNVPSATQLGSFVVFAKNAWKIGYVRQVMTDVSYIPWNDAYVLTMTSRYAIGKKDTVAAVTAFNLNVA